MLISTGNRLSRSPITIKGWLDHTRIYRLYNEYNIDSISGGDALFIVNGIKPCANVRDIFPCYIFYS